MPYHLSMTVELNERETNLILRGLGELPAKRSMQMILRLRMLWHEQHGTADGEAGKGEPAPDNLS